MTPVRWLTDLLERAFATFGEAFFAVLAINKGNVSELTALETAAVAGGLAVAKYLIVLANSDKGNTFPPAGVADVHVTVAAEPKPEQALAPPPAAGV